MVVQRILIFRFIIWGICYCSFASCVSGISALDEEDDFQEQNDSQDEASEELVSENNLLKNGGFERWMSGVPNGFFYNNYSVKKESKIVYEGRHSAKMVPREGTTAKLYQRIKVTPNQRIRICFHYYIEEGKSNGARVYSYFRTTSSENISNATLKDIYDKETMKIIRGGGYGKSYFPLEIGKWQTFDYVITTPSIANYFVFEIHSYYGTTIYIDDCYVVASK